MSIESFGPLRFQLVYHQTRRLRHIFSLDRSEKKPGDVKVDWEQMNLARNGTEPWPRTVFEGIYGYDPRTQST
jgi:hypothetical protein